MTAVLERMTQEVPESTSCRLSFTLEDEAEAPIPLAGLTTLRLWLYDEDTETPINSRSNVDIKNANGGTVHATDGSVTLKLGPADNALQDATKDREWHVAFFEWTYNGGTDTGSKGIAFRIHPFPFQP